MTEPLYNRKSNFLSKKIYRMSNRGERKIKMSYCTTQKTQYNDQIQIYLTFNYNAVNMTQS
ncbi:hypothetical protein GCM10022393_03000 [Aquimarina addita]|uniref:Uncharacterized protein n=1 Tax=Aquimarina addita TaxID=870485 RepID=A0ABP7X9G1_9FLAO